MDTAEMQLFLPCGHLEYESAVTAQNDESNNASCLHVR